VAPFIPSQDLLLVISNAAQKSAPFFMEEARSASCKLHYMTLARPLQEDVQKM
jgi:hypothetical protein